MRVPSRGEGGRIERSLGGGCRGNNEGERSRLWTGSEEKDGEGRRNGESVEVVEIDDIVGCMRGRGDKQRVQDE